MRLGACKTGLSPPPQLFYMTDRSKAILPLWFKLFCVFESIFVLFEPYVRFHFSLVRVTKSRWPPIGE